MSEAAIALPVDDAVASTPVNGAKPQIAYSRSGDPDRDSNIAQSMVRAVRAVNDAMDEAIKAGLIVEPTFTTATSRFDDLGISTQSYIASIKVYRKLC